MLAALLLLGACQPPVSVPETPLEITGAPYRLNVASIAVTEDYVSSRRPPHVELLADTSPAAAVKQWAAQKLVASGQQGRFELVIKNASVTEKDLPKQKTGLEGMMTKEQTFQYDGTLEVELKLYNERRALPVAHADVVAQQTLTLREDATLVDRKAIYHQMTVLLLQKLDPQLDANLRQYFSNYLM